ncbi:ribonuclease BN [Novosphingobium nitrogenifigens DSM 19370]|uniref:Ribonuclease BN n=1 Tax=Novosphingobium nitrogenifigens DSM 19370 TaxID=983920 RepID=F1Z5Y7_9SPHN|nr:YihY/virulence factor BrkB family protein [Novosphingobium nitrogenifigens]EGD60247.1 ribonuclease BN [Novosphingobium nitrogenifigens DSM 19370]
MRPGDDPATGPSGAPDTDPCGDIPPDGLAPAPLVPEAIVPSLSPEARRKRALHLSSGFFDAQVQRLAATPRTIKVIRRVWAGVINDGTIHAGNFAYMVLISLFPFCITGAALFSLLGKASEREAALSTVLAALPPVVAGVLGPVARGVLEARTGSLLWIGGAVGLWTVGSLVETIRDVLRRAYGTRMTRAFWERRLGSTGLILASVVLILLAITAQVAIAGAQEALFALAPELDGWIAGLALSRFLPTPLLFAALWIIFVTLTPEPYRGRRYPKWPGVLFVTCWWQAITIALPKLLRYLFTYDLTYGSLAGVMIALFFFWLVGLGMVVGAELNAALAETPEERDMLGQADDREAALKAQLRERETNATVEHEGA